MMETTKTLNELLVRFDDEGKFQGAHAVYLYRTVDTDTGKQVTASLGGPEAIAKASDADRKKLVAVVGEACVALAEAREAAAADAQAKASALEVESRAKAEAEAKAADAEAAKEEAEARAADYAGQLAAIALATPAPQEAAPAPADVP